MSNINGYKVTKEMEDDKTWKKEEGKVDGKPIRGTLKLTNPRLVVYVPTCGDNIKIRQREDDTLQRTTHKGGQI